MQLPRARVSDGRNQHARGQALTERSFGLSQLPISHSFKKIVSIKVAVAICCGDNVLVHLCGNALSPKHRQCTNDDAC